MGLTTLAEQKLSACFSSTRWPSRGTPGDLRRETSSSLEIGFRSTLLDGNLQLNGAAYHTEIDDMQFFEFYVGPFGLLRTVEGIDEATVQGFELGASWQMTDSLRLDAGYSSIDGEIDAMTVRPYVVGNDIPNAAEFTATRPSHGTRILVVST